MKQKMKKKKRHYACILYILIVVDLLFLIAFLGVYLWHKVYSPIYFMNY